jgi:hypothetical protein
MQGEGDVFVFIAQAQDRGLDALVVKSVMEGHDLGVLVHFLYQLKIVQQLTTYHELGLGGDAII